MYSSPTTCPSVPSVAPSPLLPLPLLLPSPLSNIAPSAHHLESTLASLRLDWSYVSPYAPLSPSLCALLQQVDQSIVLHVKTHLVVQFAALIDGGSGYASAVSPSEMKGSADAKGERDVDNNEGKDGKDDKDKMHNKIHDRFIPCLKIVEKEKICRDIALSRIHKVQRTVSEPLTLRLSLLAAPDPSLPERDTLSVTFATRSETDDMEVVLAAVVEFKLKANALLEQMAQEQNNQKRRKAMNLLPLTGKCSGQICLHQGWVELVDRKLNSKRYLRLYPHRLFMFRSHLHPYPSHVFALLNDGPESHVEISIKGSVFTLAMGHLILSAMDSRYGSFAFRCSSEEDANKWHCALTLEQQSSFKTPVYSHFTEQVRVALLGWPEFLLRKSKTSSIFSSSADLIRVFSEPLASTSSGAFSPEKVLSVALHNNTNNLSPSLPPLPPISSLVSNKNKSPSVQSHSVSPNKSGSGSSAQIMTSIQNVSSLASLASLHQPFDDVASPSSTSTRKFLQTASVLEQPVPSASRYESKNASLPLSLTSLSSVSSPLPMSSVSTLSSTLMSPISTLPPSRSTSYKPDALILTLASPSLFLRYLQQLANLPVLLPTTCPSCYAFQRSTPAPFLKKRGRLMHSIDSLLFDYHRTVGCLNAVIQDTRLYVSDVSEIASASQINFSFMGFSSQVFDVGRWSVVSLHQLLSAENHLHFTSDDITAALASSSPFKELMQCSPDVDDLFAQGPSGADEARSLSFEAQRLVLHHCILASYLKSRHGSLHDELSVPRSGDLLPWHSILQRVGAVTNEQPLNERRSLTYAIDPTLLQMQMLLKGVVSEDVSVAEKRPLKSAPVSPAESPEQQSPEDSPKSTASTFRSLFSPNVPRRSSENAAGLKKSDSTNHKAHKDRLSDRCASSQLPFTNSSVPEFAQPCNTFETVLPLHTASSTPIRTRLSEHYHNTPLSNGLLLPRGASKVEDQRSSPVQHRTPSSLRKHSTLEYAPNKHEQHVRMLLDPLHVLLLLRCALMVRQEAAQPLICAAGSWLKRRAAEQDNHSERAKAVEALHQSLQHDISRIQNALAVLPSFAELEIEREGQKSDGKQRLVRSEAIKVKHKKAHDSFASQHQRESSLSVAASKSETGLLPEDQTYDHMPESSASSQAIIIIKDD